MKKVVGYYLGKLKELINPHDNSFVISKINRKKRKETHG